MRGRFNFEGYSWWSGRILSSQHWTWICTFWHTCRYIQHHHYWLRWVNSIPILWSTIMHNQFTLKSCTCACIHNQNSILCKCEHWGKINMAFVYLDNLEQRTGWKAYKATRSVFSLHNYVAIPNALATSAGSTLPVNLWHHSSYCPTTHHDNI